jgi:hypothetical protein
MDVSQMPWKGCLSRNPGEEGTDALPREKLNTGASHQSDMEGDD